MRAFLRVMMFSRMMATVAESRAQSRAELEEKFKETLENVFMIGRWSMLGDGKLGGA